MYVYGGGGTATSIFLKLNANIFSIMLVIYSMKIDHRSLNEIGQLSCVLVTMTL